jgi:hypothetical protein
VLSLLKMLAHCLKGLLVVGTMERRRAIQEQLLAYCGLDTYGLARLWCFLSGRRWPKDAGDRGPFLERSQPPGAAVAAPPALL